MKGNLNVLWIYAIFMLLIFICVCNNRSENSEVKQLTEYILMIEFTPPTEYIFGDQTDSSGVPIGADDTLMYDIFVVQKSGTKTRFDAFMPDFDDNVRRSGNWTTPEESTVVFAANQRGMPVRIQADTAGRFGTNPRIMIRFQNSKPLIFGWDVGVQVSAKFSGTLPSEQDWVKNEAGNEASVDMTMSTNRRPGKPTNVTIQLMSSLAAMEYAVTVQDMKPSILLDNIFDAISKPYMNLNDTVVRHVRASYNDLYHDKYDPGVDHSQAIANRLIGGNYSRYKYVIITKDEPQESPIAKTNYIAYIITDETINDMEEMAGVTELATLFTQPEAFINTKVRNGIQRKENPPLKLFIRTNREVNAGDSIETSGDDAAFG